MPSRKRGPPKTNSMAASLHAAVATELESRAPGLNYPFHYENTETGCKTAHNTNIMGKFICYSPGCRNVWASKKIATRIRLYRDGQYNARVYHQRCKKCLWVIKPKLDEGCYVERIVYRLMKWGRVQGLEAPPYNRGNGRGPHIKHLCEGCKAGHCSRSLRDGEEGSEEEVSWSELSGFSALSISD